ncbi:MAG TPA: hypothetical protein VLW50_24205, partial [Streptosporangiaceae bacterium]|nr:hypothetical protein [Streptosporangiaceae bacterium]
MPATGGSAVSPRDGGCGAGAGAGAGAGGRGSGRGRPPAGGLAEQGIWLCGGGDLSDGLAGASARMGFRQGGVLEGLLPGPELAVFLRDSACAGPGVPDSDAGDAGWREEATGSGNDLRVGGGGDGAAVDGAVGGGAGGLGLLGDDALTGVVRGWRRLGSWAAAMEHAAVAELAGRRIGEARSGG